MFQRIENNCKGFVDSNFESDLEKRRSPISYVFTLAGGAIS